MDGVSFSVKFVPICFKARIKKQSDKTREDEMREDEMRCFTKHSEARRVVALSWIVQLSYGVYTVSYRVNSDFLIHPRNQIKSTQYNTIAHNNNAQRFNDSTCYSMTYFHSLYFNFCLFDSFIAIFRNVFSFSFFRYTFSKIICWNFNPNSTIFKSSKWNKFWSRGQFKRCQNEMMEDAYQMQLQINWYGCRLFYFLFLSECAQLPIGSHNITYSVYDRQSVPVTMSRSWLTDEGVKRNKHGETETKSYR